MRRLIKQIFRVMLLALSAISNAAQPSQDGARPDLAYFRVVNIPLSGWDAPAISNNWLWAQATTDGSILSMEDIRPGAAKSLKGSVDVLVNGEQLRANPQTADWLPNTVIRRATLDGVEFTGTVRAARQKYAILSRLEVHNTTDRPVSLEVEIRLTENGGFATCVEAEATGKHSLNIRPGETQIVRAINLYRSDAATLNHLLANFDAEWQASDDYWNELLEDAFSPGPGPLVSGGVPTFRTADKKAQRFYNFGVVTALLLMKNDPDNQSGHNLYVTAMPDATYGTFMYLWDVGYASEILAMLDPLAMRTILERWASVDIHSLLAVAYENPDKAFAPGRFYAANGSMFFLSVWNYINTTGDYKFLDRSFGGRTVIEKLRIAANWHQTRQQKNGLAHYGAEANLFDDETVKHYDHYVAAPNAADVWVNRKLADIYEDIYHNSQAAGELRGEADRLAKAVNGELYNARGDYAGTWKQLHEDGSMTELRHSWDFMLAATFMTPDLTSQQRQAMRDWFVTNLVKFDSDDLWIVAEDPRDGNNGEHQMEHNGRGAYPAWPYHDGWALHAMGFQKDVVKLLQVIDGVTVTGAISQGYFPNGRRCRPNWANIAGATAAAYPLHNVFDVWPGLGDFAPHPDLAGFDPGAYFENVPVRGTLYRVSADGATSIGTVPRMADEGANTN